MMIASTTFVNAPGEKTLTYSASKFGVTSLTDTKFSPALLPVHNEMICSDTRILSEAVPGRRSRSLISLEPVSRG